MKGCIILMGCSGEGYALRFHPRGPSVPWQGRIQRLGTPRPTADPQVAPDHIQTLTPAFKAAWEARLPPLLEGREGPRHLRVCRLQSHTCLDACREGMERDGMQTALALPLDLAAEGLPPAPPPPSCITLATDCLLPLASASAK